MSETTYNKISVGVIAYSLSLLILAVSFFFTNETGNQKTDYYATMEGKPFPILEAGNKILTASSDVYPIYDTDADLNIATVYVMQNLTRWHVLSIKTFANEETDLSSLKEEFLEAGGTEEQWVNFQIERSRRSAENENYEIEIYRTMLNNSTITAAAAALKILGEEISYNIHVAGVSEGSPAAEAGLKEGDRIVAINGEPQSIVSLSDYLQTIPGTALTYTVLRDDALLTFNIEAVLNPDMGGRLLIGIVGYDVADIPIDTVFRNPQVGGASAGLVFGIALYEYLTEDKLLMPDKKYGGTGSITPDGEILPINGLNQKISAADKTQHDYFFIPATQCEQITITKKLSTKIIPVDTLQEAINVLKLLQTEPEEVKYGC